MSSVRKDLVAQVQRAVDHCGDVHEPRYATDAVATLAAISLVIMLRQIRPELFDGPSLPPPPNAAALEAIRKAMVDACLKI